MQYRKTLRTRIIVSFLIFGTVLCGLFAVSALVMREQLEDQLIGATLTEELNDYVEQFRKEPGLDRWAFSGIRGYLFSERKLGNVPSEWRDLEEGVHDVSEDGRTYKIAVRKDEDLWSFLVYDIQRPASAQWIVAGFLVAAVLVFSVLSLLLGIWSSKRVMKPVTDLAGRLERMSEQQRHEPLARYYADDEVGALAEALDHYAEQLQSLVERDKEFNADVSHELRTPLAVIRSATELLLAQPDLPSKTRTRLLRIERAARQSAELTTALLHLVREQPPDPHSGEAHDIGIIAQQVVDSHRPQLGYKPVEIQIHTLADLRVRAPDAILSVAIGNLIGNAFKYTSEGHVTILVQSDRVRVEDTGSGIASEDMPRVFGRHYRGQGATGKGSGLGLAIVQRLCNLYDWEVEIGPREGGGTWAELRFRGSVVEARQSETETSLQHG
jgi:signal transduction histidine kinase